MATAKKTPPIQATGQAPPPEAPPSANAPPSPPGSFDDFLARGRRIPIDTGLEPPFEIEGTVNVRGSGPDGTVPVSGSITGPVEVQLQRSAVKGRSDQALWVAIRDRTRAIGFDSYNSFLKDFFNEDPREFVLDAAPALDVLVQRGQRRPAGSDLRFGVNAYQLLKAATEAFLIARCGVLIDEVAFKKVRDEEEGRLGRSFSFDDIKARLDEYLGVTPGSEGVLPYLKKVLENSSADASQDTLLTADAFTPCLLELIWSYWHEEGMLVQALNAVSLRFQNKRPSERNPLTQLELSPLRPLSNLLWGHIQDEPFRLTVPRRAYEYSHHYGLSLVGKAVPTMRPADNRSKFLEAFHSLLRQAAIFYNKDADTTVIADGFPLLNGLKEVHMLLAEGAHNQFRDLPWTARVEMLIQQWLLSQAEMKEFLRGRAMVPYQEPWMGQVDTLRRLFGWGDTPVTHFRDLAVYGEQILLSIRYGNWVDANSQDQVKVWVRYWKDEIQNYIHNYRAVTGVDLGVGAIQESKVDATLPSVLLQRRLASQGTR